MDFLKTTADRQFEVLGDGLFRNSWEARNDYITVLLDERSTDEFVDEHCRPLSDVDKERAVALLEIQKNSLLMFTSCGWFFSDLAGIETIQILRYAARLIELQERLGFESRKRTFLEMLAEARSNNSDKGNGAEIFTRFAMSDRVPSAVS